MTSLERQPFSERVGCENSVLLDVSTLSVVIVIIAICDMSRQEFSLCERVYNRELPEGNYLNKKIMKIIPYSMGKA